MNQNLSGDRYVEYSWVARYLPPAQKSPQAIFDLGPAEDAVPARFAIARGYNVEAVGLMPIKFKHPSLQFIQLDFLEYDVDMTFSWILNISTIEHFGLAGRYGVTKDMPDADLEGMARLRTLMWPDSTMLLTIPVGLDAVVQSYHRVYGTIRLPLLLDGYKVEYVEYWGKRGTGFWDILGEGEALNTPPQMALPTYYALGLFICKLD